MESGKERGKSMIRPITFGNITLKNNVFIAPLAGYTDVGYRHVQRLLGAGLTCTEMVSAKGLFYDSSRTQSLLALSPLESPSAVQIFGSDSDIMAEITASSFLSKFDIIDINMGCPMGKIVRNNEGGALMGNPKLAEKIISSCVKAAKNRPVTVKFRAGLNQNLKTAPEFAKMCEGAGASLVTVHGRTLEQLYSGKADRSVIAEVVKAVKIPVIGNGDIDSVESCEEMFSQTNCAGVMLARGLLKNPYLAAEILKTTPMQDKKSLILLHLTMLADSTSESNAVLNFRKHMAYYLKGIDGSRAFKDEVNACESIEEMREIIEKAFINNEK